MRDCVATPFMVREPHHERGCLIVKYLSVRHFDKLSAGSEHVEGLRASCGNSPIQREETLWLKNGVQRCAGGVRQPG